MKKSALNKINSKWCYAINQKTHRDFILKLIYAELVDKRILSAYFTSLITSAHK